MLAVWSVFHVGLILEENAVAEAEVSGHGASPLLVHHVEQAAEVAPSLLLCLPLALSAELIDHLVICPARLRSRWTAEP